MLKINDLTVKNTKKILDKLNLEIKAGEIHAIMGPNGVGKSTLAKVIMAHPSYEVISGKISYKDEDITHLTPDQIALKNIYFLGQNPTEIEGVSLYKLCYNLAKLRDEELTVYDFDKQIKEYLKELSLPEDVLKRDVNVGFSGGEKKKIELLQIKVLQPDLIILDEIDSGLDVDSLNLICKELNNYCQQRPETALLIITHYPRILSLIKPDYVHILNQGRIVQTGDLSLAYVIEKYGYDKTNNTLGYDQDE